jgi:hypothetical protein
MATSTILNPNTSLMLVNTTGGIDKSVVLTFNESFLNESVRSPGFSRIIYFKNVNTGDAYSGTLNLFLPTTLVMVGTDATFRNIQEINAKDCLTLQEISQFDISGNPIDVFYPISLFNFSSANFEYVGNPSPASLAVSIPGNTSFVFVDLETQSKTLLLPKIGSISDFLGNCPYFMIKDTKGFAGTNNLFISTIGGAVLDGFENSSICISTNFASIELAASPDLNEWFVLNYFNGII